MRLRLTLAAAIIAACAVTLSGTFASFSDSQTASTSLGSNSTFAPINSVAPSLPANVSIGGSVSVTPGTWTNSNVTITKTYQWQFCLGGSSCANVSGATGTTFSTNVAVNTSLATYLTNVLSGHILAAGDAIRVVETADNGYGTAPTQSSNTSVLS